MKPDNSSLKIAFLLSQFPSISETFILNQVRGLLDNKQNLSLFPDGSERGESAILSEAESTIISECTFQSTPMPCPIPERLRNSVPIVLRGLKKNPGSTIQSLNIIRYNRLAASLRLLFRQDNLLDAPKQFDVVHAHYGYNGILACILARHGFLRGPLVTTFYGHDVRQMPNGWGPVTFNDLRERASAILVLSNAMKNELEEKGFPRKKLKVHHLGIDCERFEFKPRKIGKAEPARLVSVARLVEKKGLEYGIRAVAKVAEKHPDVIYEIVGGGKLEGGLRRLISELGVQKNIRLLGWQQQPEVVEALRRAHVFLCPSVTTVDGDQEGTPTVLMEAQAQGLPVISTWHAGIPEVILDGESGFLVKERDVDELSASIEKMMASSDRWPEFGQRGRSHIEAEFNTVIQTKRLMKIYQKVSKKQSS